MKKYSVNQYYNDNYFNFIQKMVHENRLEKAIDEYEKYLLKYSNDCCGYAHYADALIKLGRFEEAKHVLDNIVINNKTPNLSKQEVELMKLKLYSCLGQYEKCLEMLRDNFDMFDEKNWNVLELLIFFKKNLGLLLVDDYSGYSYKIDQITDYSEERAIGCIRKCHFDSGTNPPFCFNDSFDLERVYNEIRSMLPLENKIYSSVFENMYIFKYDNCGRVDGKVVDYIKIITLLESNDIITMYPYKNKERASFIDITPEYDCPKVKRISQIDKFNQRYNNV